MTRAFSRKAVQSTLTGIVAAATVAVAPASAQFGNPEYRTSPTKVVGINAAIGCAVSGTAALLAKKTNPLKACALGATGAAGAAAGRYAVGQDIRYAPLARAATVVGGALIANPPQGKPLLADMQTGFGPLIVRITDGTGSFKPKPLVDVPVAYVVAHALATGEVFDKEASLRALAPVFKVGNLEGYKGRSTAGVVQIVDSIQWRHFESGTCITYPDVVRCEYRYNQSYIDLALRHEQVHVEQHLITGAYARAFTPVGRAIDGLEKNNLAGNSAFGGVISIALMVPSYLSRPMEREAYIFAHGINNVAPKTARKEIPNPFKK